MSIPQQSQDYVLWLTGAPVQRELVGGKGAGLSSLAALGAAVPASFALTTAAYRSAAKALGVPMRINAVKPNDLPEIRATIAESELPPDLAGELAGAYQQLHTQADGDLSVAVRSSATAEDSASFSFAGLHDTLLGVRGVAALEMAVKQIWASLWADRAVSYRRQGGLAADEAAIAVVVQRMVKSDVSFIAFTADPVTGRTDRLVIDATWGLGEALVSGLVTPDHIVVDQRGRIVEQIIGEKASMIIPNADGTGTRQVSVPRVIRTVPALQPDHIAEIASRARALADTLGQPTDFEGGLVDGQIYFFQARPITTIAAGRFEQAA